ncbi:MAG: Gfo/Idh/MocA family oxidoreductase, partial [Armatimonadota bacterium]
MEHTIGLKGKGWEIIRHQLPFRVGLVGCGRIARAHVRGYQQLPHMFSVIACCDMNRAAAEAFTRQLPDTAVFTDYREMFDRVDLD